MTGTLYQRYEERSSTIREDIGLTIYGDGKVLYSNITAEETEGFEPAYFDIDLTGVLELRVALVNDSLWVYHDLLGLGDVGLWS